VLPDAPHAIPLGAFQTVPVALSPTGVSITTAIEAIVIARGAIKIVVLLGSIPFQPREGGGETPLGLSIAAWQLALLPPLLPAQVQLHDPVPVTDEAVPAEHSPVVGAKITGTLLASPHTPFTRSGALQLALLPPLLPAHLQFHGPAPVTDEAMPAVHSPVVGAEVTPTPLAEPHTPETWGAGV
jgi:hypothetical protein